MDLTSEPPRTGKLAAQAPRLAYLLAGLGALYALIMLLSAPRWTVDDAYISFRYAYNLVHYGELNWNVGYNPVEGYTGVLLPLLIAPAIALGGDPALASQAIGLLSYAASALLLWQITGRVGLPAPVRGVVQALFFITPAFYTHAFAGLETMLFTALILASFDALLRRADVQLLALLLLTSLTRPEGVLLAALCCGVRLAQCRQSTPQLRRLIGRIALIYALPGACYFAWRWSYYGYLLPNTFYVKTSSGGFGASGLVWIGAYLLFPLLAMLLTVPSGARLRAHGLEFAAFAVFAATLFLLYTRSMLVMNYGHRFYMPLYPLCLVLLGALAGFERRQPRVLALALIPLSAQVIWCVSLLAGGERAWIVDYRDTLQHEHAATAEYIRAHVPQDEWVILNDTGIMPYLSQRKTIDSGGLNDEFLAHTHDPAAIRAYLRSFHAAAITIPWFVGSDERGLNPYDSIPDPGDYQLTTDYKDPAWRATYTGFRVYLFLRNDLVK